MLGGAGSKGDLAGVSAVSAAPLAPITKVSDSSLGICRYARDKVHAPSIIHGRLYPGPTWWILVAVLDDTVAVSEGEFRLHGVIFNGVCPGVQLVVRFLKFGVNLVMDLVGGFGLGEIETASFAEQTHGDQCWSKISQ